MTKVSFNAQALGIANYDKRSNVGHSEARGSRVAIVRADPCIKSLFEGLGFADVESFPTPGDKLPTKNIDT